MWPPTAEKGKWATRESTFWKVQVCICGGSYHTPTCIRNSILKRNASLSRLPRPINSDTCSSFFSVTLLTLRLLGKSCEVCTERWLTCHKEGPRSNTHVIICTPIHTSQPAPQKWQRWPARELTVLIKERKLISIARAVRTLWRTQWKPGEAPDTSGQNIKS